MNVTKPSKFVANSILGEILYGDNNTNKMPNKIENPVTEIETKTKTENPIISVPEKVVQKIEKPIQNIEIKLYKGSGYEFESMPNENDAVMEFQELNVKRIYPKKWDAGEAKKWHTYFNEKNISQAELCKMIATKKNISVTKALNIVNTKENDGYIFKFKLNGAYHYSFNYLIEYLDEAKEEEAAFYEIDFGKTKKEVFDIMNNFEFKQYRIAMPIK